MVEENYGSRLTKSNIEIKGSVVTRPGLDIEAIADYEGKPITELSLDTFEDKPWRKPGADITDYFNYGFDELTWSAYCSKQDKLSDFTPQKVMAMLNLNPMDMAMMAPGPMMPPPGGFPGVPPGFNDMMGMPGMGMFGGDMPAFQPMNDNGAYGGSNVQGVAGVVANPHAGNNNGYFNNNNNGNPNYNNNNNNNINLNNNNNNNMNYQRNNNHNGPGSGNYQQNNWRGGGGGGNRGGR